MATCIKCKAEIPDVSVYCMFCGKKQAHEPRKALKRANGTGTVYKLSGRRKKPWAAAKSGVLIGTFERKTDALEALDRLINKPISEYYNWTFEQVYTAWNTEHYKEISPSGVRGYKAAYKVFEPLVKKPYRSLRTADFQECLDKKELSYAFAAKAKQLLVQMNKWATREEIVSTNFPSFVRVPKKDKKEKEIFSDDDIKLLEADNSDASRIIRMMIHTGVRIGEMFDFKLEDYHGTYIIGGEKTEAGRNRTIPIPTSVQADFQYFADRATGEQFLSGYTGNRTKDNFRNIDYYGTLKRLGIEKKTPHATRHTYASLARKAGMQPEILQKILGHTDYQTTANIYVHTDVDALVTAAQSL